MIDVTTSAAEEIQRLLEPSEHAKSGGLRLSVKGGGCAGMSYNMEIVAGANPEDKVWQGEGVQVFIDPKSYLFLKGVIVDFKENLMGRGFVFENPNASGSCGCGTSFSIS